MKNIILSILISVSLSSHGQKIALLDNDLKKPILYTDSLTLEQVSKNYFPIQANAFDSVFTNLKFLKEFLSTPVQRAKMKSFELHAAGSKIKVTTVAHAYGDAYDIEFITKVDEVSSTYKFGDNELLNKKAIKKINKLMDYMKSASRLFDPKYVDMQPRIYEVVVYKE